MPLLRRLLMMLAVVLVAVFTPRARAQKFTVGKVEFRNAGALSPQDLEAVAAFHAGEKVTTPDIQTAAQHLMDTGFFDDVKVDSAGPISALTIIFLLKPLPPGEMLPVSFENFVWLTDADLQEIVHRTFPLFRGALPETSNQLAAIDAGLTAALVSKGVAQVQVSHDVLPPTTAQPTRTIAFRVSEPAVVVGKISVQGLAPPFDAEVTRIAAKLKNAPFANGAAPDGVSGLLLKPYLDAGYVNARLTSVQMRPLQQSPQKVSVDFDATIAPGQLYRVDAIDFAESPLVSQAAFAAGQKLHPGDVASESALLATIAPIDAAYHQQGYMDAHVEIAKGENDAAHTVTYHLTAVPGEQFRLHSVVVQGLSPEAKAQFDSSWKLKPGELYDADYVRAFITNNTAMLSLNNYAGSFQAQADPQTRLVDLTLNFVRVNGAR